MSGGLREANPHGRGHKLTARSPRAEIPSGVLVARSTFEPKDYQRAALASDRGIDLIVGGLGSGKSTIAARKLLAWALRYPRRRNGTPTKWLLAGPDFALLRQEQMELVLEQARSFEGLPYEAVVRRVVYGQDPRIYLAHGQVILCRSGAEPRRMRGHAFDGGWLDEADYQPEEAFTMALARQRSADAIRLAVTSSPANVRGSWLWPLISGESRAHDKLREATELRVHRWRSEQNDENEAEVLAAIEAALEASGRGLAAQELSGLFLGGEVREEGAFDLERAFFSELALTAQDARAAVLGVDLGRAVDFTWLTVLGRTGVVLYMERFNAHSPGVPREDFYPFAEARVAKLVETWRVPLVKVDTAMHGMAFSEGLRRALGGRARVEGYRTDSARRKAEAFEALGLALSRAQVRVPGAWTAPDGRRHAVEHVEQLRRELSELVVEPRAGYRAFDHAQGGHDDGPVALALAFQGLTARPPRRDYSKFKGGPSVPPERTQFMRGSTFMRGA